MNILNTLAPILLILALGAWLARRNFLGQCQVDDMTRLVFWVGIPSLIVHSLAVASVATSDALTIAVVLAVVTLAGLGSALAVARLFRFPFPLWGTLAQAAYRGNLVFVGLPVLYYGAAEAGATAHLGASQAEIMALAVVALTPVLVLYNLVSVVVLVSTQGRVTGPSLPAIGRQILHNPLILACVTGGVLMVGQIELPLALLRSLETVGRISIPLSLLAIGATVATSRAGAAVGPLAAATLIKLAWLPLLAWTVSWLLDLESLLLWVIMVFAACPTAVASYVMAVELGGDGRLASGAIVATTVGAFVPLTAVVILFG
jgi:predicted permease